MRGISSSRLAAERNVRTTAAMSTGATTRIRGTPAAMSAVISWCRWIQAIVNMAAINTNSALKRSKNASDW